MNNTTSYTNNKPITNLRALSTQLFYTSLALFEQNKYFNKRTKSKLHFIHAKNFRKTLFLPKIYFS